MKRILFLFLALSLSFSTLAFAHGGRTDEYGGHHDYNNVSGLGSHALPPARPASQSALRS